jgi:hypothetical protein
MKFVVQPGRRRYASFNDAVETARRQAPAGYVEVVGQDGSLYIVPRGCDSLSDLVARAAAVISIEAQPIC